MFRVYAQMTVQNYKKMGILINFVVKKFACLDYLSYLCTAFEKGGIAQLVRASDS